MPRAELQALALVQKQESPGRHHLESISVAKEEEEALWEEHFAGKLQSQNELRKGFNLTRPIPMILSNELRISTDPTEVYLELLDRFGKEDLNLREKEDTGFVSLCFRNDVFLERHWKKILRDVRYGAPAASHFTDTTRGHRTMMFYAQAGRRAVESRRVLFS